MRILWEWRWKRRKSRLSCALTCNQTVCGVGQESDLQGSNITLTFGARGSHSCTHGFRWPHSSEAFFCAQSSYGCSQGQGFLCELRAVRLPGKTECLECIDKTLKQLRLHLPQQSSRSWGQQDFHLRSAIMQTGKTRKTGRRRNLETSEGESLNLESSDLALSRTARRVRNEQMLRRQLLQGLSRHGPQRKIENGTNFEVSQVHSGGCIAATQLPAALRGAG